MVLRCALLLASLAGAAAETWGKRVDGTRPEPHAATVAAHVRNLPGSRASVAPPAFTRLTGGGPVCENGLWAEIDQKELQDNLRDPDVRFGLRDSS